MAERMLQPYFATDELVNWPFGSSFGAWPAMKNFSSNTGISVWEEDNDVVVEASLPGIKSDQVNVVFEKGNLTIQASKQEEKEDKAKKYYQKSEASFQYALKVPGEIDDSLEPQANLKDGVLQVRFKKHKRSTPKKIAVKNS